MHTVVAQFMVVSDFIFTLIPFLWFDGYGNLLGLRNLFPHLLEECINMFIHNMLSLFTLDFWPTFTLTTSSTKQTNFSLSLFQNLEHKTINN